MTGDKPVGGDEWTRDFMEAVREAVSEAVEKHHRAGLPVYVTDEDGDICEFSPDKKMRKLSKEEIEQILSAE